MSLVQVGELCASRQVLEGAARAARVEPEELFQVDVEEFYFACARPDVTQRRGLSCMTSDHLFPVLENKGNFFASGNVPSAIVQAILGCECRVRVRGTHFGVNDRS